MMDFLDFLLFPAYAYLFYLYLKRRSAKIDDSVVRKYFINGFWVRVVSTFLFTIFLTYVSPGDSSGVYFPTALDIYKKSLGDFSMIGKLIFTQASNIDHSLLLEDTGQGVVFGDENNYMVVRVAAVLMFFSFGKYMIANFLFSMVAFSGCWRLFIFFSDLYPERKRELAIAVLYFPSFIFWSSGISKEAICIAGIGYITYALYSIFIKKQDLLQSIFYLFFFGYLLVNVKIYILISYVPFISYFILLNYLKTIKNRLLKVLTGPVLLISFFVTFFIVLASNEDKLGMYAVESLASSIEQQQKNFMAQEGTSGSNFSFVDYDGSILGFLKVAPLAVTTALFRPFLWESKKISTLFSSLESLALMFFTLYVMIKKRVVKFLLLIFKQPLIMYCFLYALTFSFFVGLTTLNFGSLVRYKIPCLPFYLIALFLILADTDKPKSPNIA